MRSKHHIKPLSRNGGNDKSNIAIISSKPHEKYHSLFGNRTPYEIIDYLVSYFWNGNKEHLMQYLERR
jgi:hypothetical protein